MSNSSYSCPNCHARIPVEDVNVATDLALCRRCGQTSPFSALVDSAATAGTLTVPKGLVFEEQIDGFRIVCSTRSKAAFFLVPFMLVWSGFSLGGIYGTQLLNGKFNPMMSLFGLPFLLGTIVIGVVVLMSIWGHIVITRNGGVLECFTGLGSIGFRKRAPWSAIRQVREEASNGRSNGRQQWRLVLEGDERVVIANGLSDEHRYFVRQKLSALLAQRR